MPRGDRKGPDAEGPMTGRRLGFCVGNDRPGFEMNRERGSLQKKRDETRKREKSEKERHQKIYNIDLTNTEIYDLVINTENKKPSEIARIVMDALDHQNIWHR